MIGKVAGAIVAALVSSLIAAALSVAQGFIQAALMKKDKPRRVSSPSRAQKQNLQETTNYIPVVFGRALVGGTRAFIEVKNAYRGTEFISVGGQAAPRDTEGTYLYLKTVHSFGECEAIEDIRLNDVSILDEKFSDGYKVTVDFSWIFEEPDPVVTYSYTSFIRGTNSNSLKPIRYRLSYSDAGQNKYFILKEFEGGIQQLEFVHDYGTFDYKLEYLKDDGEIIEVGTASASLTFENEDFTQTINNNLTLSQNSFLDSQYILLPAIDKLGQAEQTAVQEWLQQGVPGYTSKCRGVGLCYSALRLLKHTKGSKAEKQPIPSLPSVTALIKGVKVYDPRKDSTNTEAAGSGTHREYDPNTWEYTTNPILLIRYVLMHCPLTPRLSSHTVKELEGFFGDGLLLSPDTSHIIDDALVRESADYCDDLLSYNGETFKRYECNGVLDPGKAPKDNLLDLLDACNARFTRVPENGVMKVRLKVLKPETPVKTLEQESFFSSFDVAKGDLKSRTNTINLKWTSEALNWETEIKTLSNPAFVEEDGAIYESDLDLPFCDNYNQAYYLGVQRLKQARKDRLLTFHRPLSDLDLNIGDVIAINYAPLGYSNFLVRIESVDLTDESTLRMTATEYDEDVYTVENIDPRSNDLQGNFTNPFVVEAPSNISVVQSFEFDNNGNYVPTVQLDWSSPLSSNVTSYQVDYKPLGSGDWEVLGQTPNTSLITSKLLVGNYSIRLRAINNIGFESNFYEETITVYSETDNPPDVEGFRLVGSDSEMTLGWQLVPTVGNNGFYRIKHIPTLLNPEWNDGYTFDLLVPGYQTSVSLPRIEGSYLIKAVNSARLESLNFSSVMLDLPDDTLYVTKETVDEHPNFPGVKINTELADTELVLTGSLLFDNKEGLFDVAAGLFDDGSGFTTIGTYEFSNFVDLEGVYKVRLKKFVSQTINQIGQNFNDTTGLFDDRTGLFDGSFPSFVTANVLFRVTRDDPAGSPAWSTWMELTINEIVGRAFEFRLELLTENSEQKISISQLSTFVQFRRRTEQGSDNVTGAGYTVSFNKAFYEAPSSVSVQLLNGESGDYTRVTNITKSGFDITVYNSVDAVVNREITYVVQGYGERLA